MYFLRLLTLTLLALIALTVSAPAQDKQPDMKKRNVAILVHEGVELLDFAGPGEVFQVAMNDHGRAFNVYTVGATTDPITSQGFVKVTPAYSVKDCPKPDIIVIPGGQTQGLLHNQAVMDWLKASAPETEVMFSVCTGAFVLGKLGLLDDQDATTHYASISGLQGTYPKARVHRDRRIVDNGKIVTTAGVSAGLDGALHLVARFCGIDRAKNAAKYMEYKWEPEASGASPGK